MAGIMKRGLNKLEEYQVIERLAAQKGITNPEFVPIKIMLKENKEFFMNTADVFILGDQEGNSGRVRKYVDIRRTTESHFKSRAVFVEDEESNERFTIIPKTEHNLALLASHYDQLWDIEDHELSKEMYEVSKTLKPHPGLEFSKRSSDSGQRVSHEDPTEQENLRLKEEIAALKAREGLDPRQKKRSLSDDIEIRKLAKEKEQLEMKIAALQKADSEEEAPKDDAVKDQARKIVLADKAFIDDLKDKHDRYWITPEYRDRLREEMDKIKELEVA